MTAFPAISRRHLLKGAALLGCSLAVAAGSTARRFAAAPDDNRLVILLLRGAMDGLDLVRPVGDPAFAARRPTLLAGPPAPPLDGFFALHPGLAPLLPLWQAGELGFVHAVSTPYRDRRSHFDGQDILDAGTGPNLQAAGLRGGWLNRMLPSLPGLTPGAAFGIGPERLNLLAGPAAHSFQILDAAPRPVTRGTTACARGPEAWPARREPTGGDLTARLAAIAARQLRGEARIAAFALTGWDTHAAQTAGLKRALAQLSDTILTLRRELGPVWARTAVLGMTEFGRSVRENAAGGTDHGTGGLLVLAGGAVRGGRVHGLWPGLGDHELYAGRDLMPTADLRTYTAWALRGLFGLDRSVLEGTIFPGVEMGPDPKILL